MIDVKAARQSADTPLSPAQILARSEQDAPLPMRWPGLLLAIMAAAIAYVQGLAGKSQAATPQDEAQPQQTAGEATAAVAQETPDVAKPPAQVEPEDETGSIGGENQRAIGSGQPGPAVPGLPDYLNIDSPAFDFEQLPLPVIAPIRPPPAFGEDASNDNGRFFASGAAGIALTPTINAAAAGGSGGVGVGETFITAGFTLPLRPVEPIAQPEPDLPDPRDDTPDPPAPERNRAPRVAGALRLADIGPCQASLLTALMLLAGASDADGDTLTLRKLTVSHGTLTQTTEGWLYQPQAGYFGQITLSYEISDGQAFVAQSASFDVVEFLRLIGTPQDDVLIGSECRDHIEGLDGNDLIEGRGGSDVILAGAGDDIIYGGAGNDRIFAGSGNDVVFGGAGNDIIYGGLGNDWLHGEDGDDAIYGEEGDDWLTGGAGDDLLDGGAGNDRLDGGAGHDRLVGGDGHDEIVGGEGDDVILAGDGDDIVDGGDGDDSIDGGTGRNTILTGSGNNSVVAGNGGNVVIGGTGVDTVALGSGDDVVRAGGGDDIVDAGAGRNAVFGEDGDDRLVGGDGDDVLDGGTGRDELVGGAGQDRLVGGDGDDLMDGGTGHDVVVAGTGRDTVMAGEGDDDVDAGDGNDVVLAGAGNDRVEGGAGNDILLGEAGDDCIEGGEGNDGLMGGVGQDELHGGAGDDHLAGGEGRDKVYGGSGDDTVIVDADCADDVYAGGSGTDTLDLSALRTGTVVDLVKGEIKSAEAGKDTIGSFEVVIGGSGDDTFVIGNSATTVSGGSGKDKFKFELDGRDAEEDAEELIHRILDLEVGDRIIVSQYTIRQDDDRDDDDHGDQDDFARIYGEDGDDRPFRFRIEKVGETESTFIDVLIENEGEKDFSIEVSGNHRFYYYN